MDNNNVRALEVLEILEYFDKMAETALKRQPPPPEPKMMNGRVFFYRHHYWQFGEDQVVLSDKGDLWVVSGTSWCPRKFVEHHRIASIEAILILLERGCWLQKDEIKNWPGGWKFDTPAKTRKTRRDRRHCVWLNIQWFAKKFFANHATTFKWQEGVFTQVHPKKI